MGKLIKSTFYIFFILISMVAIVVPMLPFETWLEDALHESFDKRGLGELEFTVHHVGIAGTTISDISWGNASPFTLSSITIGYTPIGIVKKQLTGVSIKDLTLRQGKMRLHIASANVDLVMKDSHHATGKWRIDDIVMKGLPMAVPALTGMGDLEWKNQDINMRGVIQSDIKDYQLAFDADYPLHDAPKAIVKLLSLRMPWNAGYISVQPTSIAIFGDKPIQAVMHVRDVSIETLVRAATQDQGRATGVLSGKLPVTINRDGSLIIKKGTLAATENGTLMLPDSVIPGSHERVDLVRTLLKNFHYSDFALGVNHTQANSVTMALAIKGKNPEVYDGRQVNLNVNLTGDLLRLIQQGMITIVDPKQLLDSKTHETINHHNRKSGTADIMHPNGASAGAGQAH